MAAALGLAVSYSFYAVSARDQLLPRAEVHPRDQGQGAGGHAGLSQAGGAATSTEADDPHAQAVPLARLVRRARAQRHDRALSRALHELRADAGRAALRQADHRHRPVRSATSRRATASTSSSRSASATASATPAASRSSSRSTRSSRTAAARPRRWTATWPISAWSRSSTAIRSTRSSSPPAATRPRRPGSWPPATVDIPAIVLSGGPMLDGWHEGELVGSGHRHLALAAAARRRRDRRGGIPPARDRSRAFGRPLQHHGHRLDDERRRRGARHVAARLRGDPGALSRARPDGLRDRPPHRRHGLRGPAAVDGS